MEAVGRCLIAGEDSEVEVFENIGWAEILVLAVVGLFVLGPERLPEGAAWLGRSIRQIKEYVTGAREQIRSELGPDFEDLRKPLEDLQEIRNFNPRTAVRKHLLEDDSSSSAAPQRSKPPEQRPLAPGERPPYDPDAT